MCATTISVRARAPQASSRYVGVHYDRTSRRWKAKCALGGRVTYLGSHGTEADAARAYDEFARAHGKPCNFPTAGLAAREGRKAPTSRFLGVYFDASSRKYVARCRLHRRKVYLGHHADEESAARAYDVFARAHGKPLNLPDPACVTESQPTAAPDDALAPSASPTGSSSSGVLDRARGVGTAAAVTAAGAGGIAACPSASAAATGADLDVDGRPICAEQHVTPPPSRGATGPVRGPCAEGVGSEPPVRAFAPLSLASDEGGVSSEVAGLLLLLGGSAGDTSSAAS